MNPPTDAEERALRRSRAKNLRERADALARANAGLFAQMRAEHMSFAMMSEPMRGAIERLRLALADYYLRTE